MRNNIFSDIRSMKFGYLARNRIPIKAGYLARRILGTNILKILQINRIYNLKCLGMYGRCINMGGR